MILSFGPAGSTGWGLGLCTALALLAYVAAALLGAQRESAVRGTLLAGWVAHALAIVVDIGGLGATVAGARFGFAPALSVTMWLVLAVYAVESRFLPLANVRRVLALLGAASVLLAFLFPGELRPHALSRWAPLHWVLGIASYGLFGAAVLHGALLNRAEQQLRQRAAGVPGGMPLLRLERLTFRFVGAGFVLLTATLIAGLFFGEQLYGASLAHWKWDHKTIFSLLAWLTFAVLLAGRARLGWRGRRAVRVLYIGAGLLLLAYVGSRFVLEVLLRRAPAS